MSHFPLPPPQPSRSLLPRTSSSPTSSSLYISLASSISLPPPPTHLGPFGYVSNVGQYPIEQVTTLGYLKSPLRRPHSIVERWNPYEISLFEGALALCGKAFHMIRKAIETKSTKEIVEFYYVWKKTSHGRRWKSSYVGEIDESDSDDEVDRVAIDKSDNNDGEGKRNVDGTIGGIAGGAMGGRGKG
ncbi:hypothetical protein ACHAXA_005000 [Cyclostephanos tholiformis]|uniref:SANT domain-containing protein n=1 Tax=Cyclostephanos tholiformis TaxID=382380 RepID=A0ABD3RYR1_9STRA